MNFFASVLAIALCLVSVSSYPVYTQSGVGGAQFLGAGVFNSPTQYTGVGPRGGMGYQSVSGFNNVVAPPMGVIQAPYPGAVFYGPQPSLMDKANHFVSKNWPVLLAGGAALYLLKRG